MIDFKDLLRRYMEHVIHEEGTAFTNSLTEYRFTEDEIKYLEELDKSID